MAPFGATLPYIPAIAFSSTFIPASLTAAPTISLRSSAARPAARGS